MFFFQKMACLLIQVKARRLLELLPPADQSEAKSSLGIANCVSRFIPNLATNVKQMRQLTKHMSYVWDQSCNVVLRSQS